MADRGRDLLFASAWAARLVARVGETVRHRFDPTIDEFRRSDGLNRLWCIFVDRPGARDG